MFRVRTQVNCEALPGSYTGKGIVVAILDTGIVFHPDFEHRIIGFEDFVHGKIHPYDDGGHGVHVAGILAGSGAASYGRYRGIAPECKLVIGKVLNEKGDGTIEHMFKGLEWVMQTSRYYPIHVLNISVGLGMKRSEKVKAELIQRIESIWDRGITVVVAAGNGGPRNGTISPIGAGGKVIAVGCHEGGYFGNRSSLCEYYSGRGPGQNHLRKPDIVAPGTDIISCCHQIERKHNFYTLKSGTSMATPIVAGAAALFFEKNPDADNALVKKKLLETATDLHEPETKQGYGMVNIGRLLMEE